MVFNEMKLNFVALLCHTPYPATTPATATQLTARKSKERHLHARAAAGCRVKYQKFRGEPGGDTCVAVGQTGPLSSLAPHCLSACNITRDHQRGTESVFGLEYCRRLMCFFISFDAESLFGLSRCVGKNSTRGIMMDEIICGKKCISLLV